MQIEKVKISQVKNNPNNPRVIKDFQFKKLVKSIKEAPWMLQLRSIIVNDDNIVLGGNQRLRACKEAGLKEVYKPIVLKTSEGVEYFICMTDCGIEITEQSIGTVALQPLK